jgi:hypothetical protein
LAAGDRGELTPHIDVHRLAQALGSARGNSGSGRLCARKRRFAWSGSMHAGDLRVADAHVSAQVTTDYDVVTCSEGVF